MTLLNQIRRMERLDYLIHSRSTGTPTELAYRLGLSRSQMFQTLKFLKKGMEAPIYYSKAQRSYCYEGEGRFVCAFIRN